MYRGSDFSGRSMVEMLGVLAIIGVLSVGAITGYQKAMFKYKMNKTIEIFSQVLTNYLQLKNNSFSETFKTEDLIKYGLIDKSQCPIQKTSDYSRCILPLGTLFGVIEPRYASIIITFNSPNECLGFLSYHWEHILPDDWWINNSKILIEAADNSLEYIYGLDKAQNKTTLTEINNICLKSCTERCDIYFIYNHDEISGY